MHDSMKNLTRRDFIRLAGLMGGATLFAGCHFLEPTPIVPQYIKGAPASDPVETIKGVENLYTVCALCPGNCGIRCRVAQGALVKIGGSPYNPISADPILPFGTPLEEALLRGGSVCAIGGSGIQTLYNPFRPARPLKRVGPRGSGKWAALTWEQAVKEIVEGGDLFGEGAIKGLKNLKESGVGPALLVGNADWGSFTFLTRFIKAFPGSVLLRDRTAQLNEMARSAADAVFGPGTGPVDADYNSARCLISFGDAPLDSGVPLVSIAREIQSARVGGRGLRWAVVDPRLSTSASKADVWVPVIPGKDLDLALGIMRALADNPAYGAKFPHEDLKKTVLAQTIQQYAEAAGLPPETLLKLARFLAEEGARSAVVPGRGILSQPNGLEIAKAILALNLMVGSSPGSGGLVRRNDEFLQKAESKLLGEKPRTTTAAQYGAPVKALILWNADPVYEDPQAADAYFKDRAKVPLSVAITSEITETTALADYILPETTYLERWDICQFPPSVTKPGIGVRSPVVGRFDPGSGKYYPIVPETRPMEEIVFHLGAELALPRFERDSNGQLKTAWHYYREAFAVLLESMRLDGFPVGSSEKDLATVVERGGVFRADSVQTGTKPTGPAGHEYKPPRIETSSEKPAAAEEGLILITYSLPFHRSPAAGLNSWLLEVLPENKVFINSADARKRNIHDLDPVLIESLDGKTRLQTKAQVVPGIRPGVMALANGFGYTQSGARPQVIDSVQGESDKPRGAGISPASLIAEGRATMVNIKKA